MTQTKAEKAQAEADAAAVAEARPAAVTAGLVSTVTELGSAVTPDSPGQTQPSVEQPPLNPKKNVILIPSDWTVSGMQFVDDDGVEHVITSRASGAPPYVVQAGDADELVSQAARRGLAIEKETPR